MRNRNPVEIDVEEIRIEECDSANFEHEESCRQYAHTFHKDGVICVAGEFDTLPEEVQLGILLHEVGHLIAGPDGTEEDANEAVEEDSGIEVFYEDTEFGEELECIDEDDVEDAKEYLGL